MQSVLMIAYLFGWLLAKFFLGVVGVMIISSLMWRAGGSSQYPSWYRWCFCGLPIALWSIVFLGVRFPVSLLAILIWFPATWGAMSLASYEQYTPVHSFWCKIFHKPFGTVTVFKIELATRITCAFIWSAIPAMITLLLTQKIIGYLLYVLAFALGAGWVGATEKDAEKSELTIGALYGGLYICAFFF